MTQRAVDLAVVGGGVFGLWIARRALQAGMSVALVEARAIGSGASGGMLGALTAHTPDRWNPKKAFQFAALVELEAEVAALEAETGASAGYRRSGRAMPVRSQAFLAQLDARSAGAEAHWRDGARRWAYARRTDEALAGWLSAEAAPLGYVADGFAGRISPRGYVEALRESLVRGGAEIVEGAGLAAWDGAAVLSDGRRIAAGAVAVSAGFESFPLLQALCGRDLGGGVQGQSALFEVAGVADRPLIYEDGVYVIPHADGTVAVGSTDRKVWAAPGAVDREDDGFLQRARALCPALPAGAPLAWWAGVRPKAWTRDPLVGRLPGAAPIWAATGGFKISFGIAHRIAAALVDRIRGASAPTSLPESFELAAHLTAAERRAGAQAGAGR